MKPSLDTLRAWVDSALTPLRRLLSSRTPRERLLVALAGVFIVAWVLWAGIFAPAQSWREDAERGASAWERRLEWLKTQPRTQARSELRPGVLTSSVGDCGLKLLRVNQEGAAILVTVQDQSFACVLDWISRIEAQHGIEVEQLRLQSGQRQGSVSGTLRFSS